MSAANQELTIDEARRALESGRADVAGHACEALVAKNAKQPDAWHLLGLARQKLGRHAEAIEALTKASSLERGNARYHHDLANALVEDGKIDRAISAYRRALRIDDTLAEAHNDLGTAYFGKQWYPEAEQCFRKAIGLKPEHGVSHANLGAALRAQGKLVDSRRAFQRALALKIRAALPAFLQWRVAATPAGAHAERNPLKAELKTVLEKLGGGRAAEALEFARQVHSRLPDDPDALHILGIALGENRDYAGAIEKFKAAIAIRSDRTEYYMSLARLLVRMDRHGEALEAANQALRLEPGSAGIHAAIAGIYHPWREDLAEQAARRAIELDASSHTGHGNLAAALWGLGRLEEAERHGREAVRLAPKQIDYRANLALTLKDLGRIEDARALYRQMISEAPGHPKISMDMGTLAVECEGDLEAARQWFRKAQASPDYPRAFLHEAIVDLLDGKFETAWPRYEARKRAADQRQHHSLFARFPEWHGESAANGRLLVYGEQGLGDEIMLASMLPDLCKRTQNVALLCDPRLGALFARSFPAVEVIAESRQGQGERAAKLDGFSSAVAAGSLGQYFRQNPRSFPIHDGYLLPDATKRNAWRARLGDLGSGLKVGISWVGGVQQTGRSRRSLSLEQLRGVLAMPGINWVSLQYTDAADELARFQADANIHIHEFAGVTRDMDELASLVGALDLVLSVCNTTVHITGAIGKEVLVMAPFAPEWRYGMHGERMIWYPSARVFRQPRYGAWDEVLSGVSQALRQRVGGK